MAVHTLGTTNNAAIATALKWVPGTGSGIAPADMATLANAIKNDQINGNPIAPGAFSYTGILYVPNRGFLMALPGDVVAVDNTGWPILVSKASIGSGSTEWVFT